MEQHAVWMKSAGAGAINVSWWGKDSDTDRLVPSLMDVMAAHDLRVTFHLEPYRSRHAASGGGGFSRVLCSMSGTRGINSSR